MNQRSKVDVIHTDGFPNGWLVQERDEYEALLCFQDPCPSIWRAPRCFCRKPRLVKIEEWLPTAKIIAAALEQAKGGAHA